MPGKSILIVDDNPSNLKLMRVLLNGEGYEVKTALNANEALASLNLHTPALILMDVQMPGMDGLELTRRIKADPATSKIPVVAVTAYAMAGDEGRALEAGCNAYVSKPIDTRALPLLISKLI